MSRRPLLLGAGAALAITIAIALAFVLRDGRGTVIARSKSPDGRFEVVIYEKTPPFPMASPYVYTLHPVAGATQSVKSDGTIDHDSAAISDFSINWSAASVSVTFNQGKSELAFDFASSHPIWTTGHH